MITIPPYDLMTLSVARRVTLLNASLTALTLLSILALPSHNVDFKFKVVYVDTNYGGNGRPGWVHSGDFDGDSDVDLIAGGGQALFVYENTGGGNGWQRHGSLDETGNIGANGAVITDVDGDGDLDVISAKFYDDIGWWENPCGASCDLSSISSWSFHSIGSVGTNGQSGPHYYLHDIVPVDFGGSSGPQIVAPAISKTCQNVAMSWFEPGSDVTAPWNEYVIEQGRSASSDGQCNHAGIDTGDIDGDGHIDVAFSNGWYEAPDNPRSSWPSGAWHPVTNYDAISNTLIRDMDGDSKMDLVVASGHIDEDHDVRWYRNPGTIGQSWGMNVIGTLRSPECLQVEDLDDDGDLDVIACDLDWDRWDQEVHNVYVFENTGNSTSWLMENVAPNSYPSHLLQLVDINKDGLPDVISEATGYSVISYLENETEFDTGTGTDQESEDLGASSSEYPVIEKAYPNPFSEELTIQYRTAAPAHVNVSVYDTMGRLVSTVTEGAVPAGAASVSWNGSTDSGANAAAGRYFVVVDADGFRQELPIMKVD